MSVCVCIGVSVLLPVGSSSALAGMLAAAVTAAAHSIGLTRIDDAARAKEFANTVDLCLTNAGEVATNLSSGQQTLFRGEGIAVAFCLDEEGRSMVRVSGNKSEDELRELGETMAKRIVQQFAYHRIVTEMKERNMNIVEEEVEEDGTVRLAVRVRQG